MVTNKTKEGIGREKRKKMNKNKKNMIKRNYINNKCVLNNIYNNIL